VFDRQGRYRYQFGKKWGGDGEFRRPRGLTVNKSGHLLFCDSWNNTIQIFQLNGNFLGKYGTKGSNLGDLRCPNSAAVLSNGTIVVCEWDRVQIFE